ncbi:HU family DNA-binding protein [Candidatus Woesebacteria bacterium]|nr:HU family DNA-binding protein [Candidatus Woesebacteria bacterium]MCD8507143.1 HU family DNA-binding protein [Candidatus Woesebacteria bacterium]MCD8527183.1 HU family DNA-binding protein [Candidatus Woesebacteria bacterium]
MNKSDLIAVVAKKANLTQKAAKEAIEVFLEETTRSLGKGQKVLWSGFGTFDVRKVADKRVVPFGREELTRVIKSHNVVNFKAGKPLKDAVK